MSKDFTIGLDLDGPCYHFDRTARYMLRKRILAYGDFATAKLLEEESTTWNGIRDIVHPDDWAWLWTDGVKNGLFRYGHIVGGAIEGVQELSQIGDVVAITARPKQAVHDTIVWLATMFDKAPLSGLVIQSHGQRKSDVHPLPDVYVDDAAHNADDILDNTTSRVVLYDTPMNRRYPLNPRVFRALDWIDVVGIIRRIKGEAP
jgi:5'(3')-deoxyribonucleotidase